MNRPSVGYKTRNRVQINQSQGTKRLALGTKHQVTKHPGYKTSRIQKSVNLITGSPLKSTSRCFYYWLAPRRRFSKRTLPIPLADIEIQAPET